MNRLGIDTAKFKPLKPDVQGWNSEHPIFEQLIMQVKPKIIIEVGTWKGASAIAMANICQQQGLWNDDNLLDTKIYCVDTFLGSVEFWTHLAETKERDLMLKNGYPNIYYQFLSNVMHAGLQDRIIPVPNTSANAARIFQYHNIKSDLIYIDASHEYEDVKADIENYSKLLNEGGVMFGDDYGWPGVNRAVNELLPRKIVIDSTYWVNGEMVKL